MLPLFCIILIPVIVRCFLSSLQPDQSQSVRSHPLHPAGGSLAACVQKHSDPRLHPLHGHKQGRSSAAFPTCAVLFTALKGYVSIREMKDITLTCLPRLKSINNKQWSNKKTIYSLCQQTICSHTRWNLNLRQDVNVETICHQHLHLLFQSRCNSNFLISSCCSVSHYGRFLAVRSSVLMSSSLLRSHLLLGCSYDSPAKVLIC